jgi:hypothetical protein
MQTLKEKPQQLTNTSTFAGRTWHSLISPPARIVLVLLTLALLALPSFAQITPSDDAYVLAANPSTRYGGAATLAVQSGSSTSYIRFDLSAIPVGYGSANVAKATLKLYVDSVTTAGLLNIDYVSGSWSERTITYSLQPALGTTVASGISITSASKGQYLQIDVTSAVGAWLDGTQQNHGLALVANSPLTASFDSKESTTFSHPPELDIVFNGNGAQGPPGPQGPQGPQGAQGPNGLSGPMGPIGPQGPTGPAGVTNRGSWSSSTNYQPNDIVAYGGSSWLALLPNNNSSPYRSNPNWQLLAGKGINNQGSWVSFVSYQVNDAVTDGGSYWLALVPSLASEPSINNPNWQLVASQGSQGAAGPIGPQGPAGATGPVGPLGPQGLQGTTGATGSQGPAGPIGPAGPQGPIGAQGIQGFVGPMGPVGPAGPQGDVGPAGPVGITNRGAWVAGQSYQVNDAVTDQGQYWLALAPTDGQEPTATSAVWQLIAAGAQGQTGPPGPPGMPGPQGPAGVTGPAGAQGPAGPQGATGLPGTGILNGTKDFTSNGTWITPTGVTRVIVELWGGGGGGGGCQSFCFVDGTGGGAGAYSRSILPVIPGATYSITVGLGGTNNGSFGQSGGATSFLDSSSTILLSSGGGIAGNEGCTVNCSTGGQPDPNAQVGHGGAAAPSACPPIGGAGFPVSSLSQTVGGGGTGAQTFDCTATKNISLAGTAGQPGYALLTW